MSARAPAMASPAPAAVRAPAPAPSPAFAGSAPRSPRLGSAHDVHEQEADRVADEVAGADARRGPPRPPAPPRPGTPRPGRGERPAGPELPAGSSDPGTALDPGTRRSLEQRMGHDFGAVRVHADRPAAVAAASLSARAFTRGRHIYFAAGEYRPQTPHGRHLLAHELTHMLQQRGGPAAPDAVARQEDPQAAADNIETTDSADTTETTDAAGVAPASPSSVQAVADDVLMILQGDPEDRAGRAKARLAGLDPRTRAFVLARVRSRLQVGHRTAAPALDEHAEAAGGTGSLTGDATSRPARPQAAPSRPDRSRAATAPGGGTAASTTTTGQPPTPTPAVPRVPPSLSRTGPTPRTPSGPPAALDAGPASTRDAANHPAGTPADMAAPDAAAESPVAPGEAAGEAAGLPDDDRPLRLAHLLEPVSLDAVPAAADAPMAASPDAFLKDVTAGRAVGPADAAARMEGYAAQLETALGEARDGMHRQATEAQGRLRQAEGAARHGVRAEVERTVAAIRTGSTALLGELATSVAAAHTQVNTNLAARRDEAVQTGIASQGTVRDIFTSHRATVASTVNENIAAAGRLRSQKAEHARTRNRADIATAYQRGDTKRRSYGGTKRRVSLGDEVYVVPDRGAFIGDAVYQVAEGTAHKMSEQEPDIVNAVGEATAPLPEYFRSQGAQALDGFDVNLPDILGSVRTGMMQTDEELVRRAGAAHGQLDQLALQVENELVGMADEAVRQAQDLGSQLETQIDRASATAARVVRAAPDEVIGRISPPVEEANELFRAAENPDVDAAGQLTEGLVGFAQEAAASTGDSLNQAAEAGQQRFGQIHDGARQAMRAHRARCDTTWQGMRAGLATTLSQVVEGVDTGFGGVVDGLQTVLTETEQSIRDQLAPPVAGLSSGFKDALRDAERQIDTRINDGLGKNTEALAEMDAKMEEAADDAAWEYDHPVLSTLAFIGGLLVGIIGTLVTIVALVAATLLIGWVLGIGVLAAGLVLVAGMAAFSIGYAFGARLAAGQGFGEALGGAFIDFGRAAPGMLYDMTGIPKLRRAFSAEHITPYQRGELVGAGATEFVTAIFVVRDAAKGAAGLFRKLPRFRPPVGPGGGPPAAPRAPVPAVEPPPPSRSLPATEAARPPIPAEPARPLPQPLQPARPGRGVPSRPVPATEPVPGAPAPPEPVTATGPGGQGGKVLKFPTQPRPPRLTPAEPAPGGPGGPGGKILEFPPRPRPPRPAAPAAQAPPVAEEIEAVAHVAEASGAPGYRPRPLSQAGSGTGRPGAGRPSGVNPVEVEASARPPGGGGRGPARPPRPATSPGPSAGARRIPRPGSTSSPPSTRAAGKPPRSTMARVIERGKAILEAFGEAHGKGKPVEQPEGTQAVGETLNPRTRAGVTDAQALANDLERVLGPRPPDHHAHHIVPKGMAEAEEAWDILERSSIGINEGKNGVWLPKDYTVENPLTGEIHATIHTSRYIRWIITELTEAFETGGPAAVADMLAELRSIIMNSMAIR